MQRTVSTININNQTYSIDLTFHSEKRLNERKIDLFQAIGAILSLGEQRINQYKNTEKDIFIMDKEHNFSIVITIEGNTIVVITVIDKVDCYVKSGTIAINI